MTGETISGVKDHDSARHPGPWRVMPGNSELAGIIVAVGFVAMGLVTMPILIIAALPLGVAVALVLRWRHSR
jgi:uncharacterized membrane protein